MHRSCDAPFCLCRSFTAGRSPGCCCARLKITGAAGSRTIVQHYDSVYEKVQHLLTATVTGCSADLIVSALAAAGISRGDMLRLNDPRRPPQQAGAFTMLLLAPQETCKLLLAWQAAKQCSHDAALCHHTAWSLNFAAAPQAKHDTLPFCHLDEAARTFVLPTLQQVSCARVVVASCSGAGEPAFLKFDTCGSRARRLTDPKQLSTFDGCITTLTTWRRAELQAKRFRARPAHEP